MKIQHRNLLALGIVSMALAACRYTVQIEGQPKGKEVDFRMSVRSCSVEINDLNNLKASPTYSAGGEGHCMEAIGLLFREGLK